MHPHSRFQQYLRLLFATTLICGWVTISPSALAGPAQKTIDLTAAARLVPLRNLPPPVDMELMDLQGRRVRLADFSGKVVLISFWATWCVYCQGEVTELQALQETFKDQNFALLTVNIKQAQHTVEQYMTRNNLTFPVLLDNKGDISRAFRVRSIPTTYLVDQAGALIGLAIGPRDWNKRPFTKLIRHLLNTP